MIPGSSEAFCAAYSNERGIECEEAGDGQAGLDQLHAGIELRPGVCGLEHAGDERAGDGEAHAGGSFFDVKVMMVTTEAENDASFARSRRARTNT